jgi:hypothetical protein
MLGREINVLSERFKLYRKRSFASGTEQDVKGEMMIGQGDLQPLPPDSRLSAGRDLSPLLADT